MRMAAVVFILYDLFSLDGFSCFLMTILCLHFRFECLLHNFTNLWKFFMIPHIYVEELRVMIIDP